MVSVQPNYVLAAFVTILVSLAFQVWRSRSRPAAAAIEPKLSAGLNEAAQRLNERLSRDLHGSVILPDDRANFTASMRAYWAQQQCEVIPSCIVRPKDTQELANLVKILKHEHERRRSAKDGSKEIAGLFAIRSGGHSPVSGAANLKGGVVVDLTHFNEVTPSGDGRSVILGTGATWGQVSRTLEKRGLAVVGGRNSEVGVGGLTLGGGLSFFSPRFGFVCDNIISCEVILADGSVVNASETEHADLWRVLKGGSNNFGIVTRFTARSFPCTDIWSGFLYMPPGRYRGVLSAYNDCLSQSSSPGNSGTMFDRYAAGPMACFTYLQQINSRIISVNIVHTNPAPNSKGWPECWANSGFAKIWRFWSDVKMRSLTNATDQMTSMNPAGRRQDFGTTTVRNDLDTLIAVHDAYNNATSALRKVKGVSWTLVLQPVLPGWAKKRVPHSLGLDEGPDEPLVNIQFTVNWALAEYDSLIGDVTRKAIEQIDRYAEAHGTGHPYRYLNYCGKWQKPFHGYGEENLRNLRQISRKYDPEGLFQTGCVGGFKLFDD